MTFSAGNALASLPASTAISVALPRVAIDSHGDAAVAHPPVARVGLPAAPMNGLTVGKTDVFAVAFGPNPLRSGGLIRLALPTSGRVRVDLYEVSGRRAAVMVDAWLGAGLHEIPIEGHNLKPGMYFYRASGSRGAASGRIVIAR